MQIEPRLDLIHNDSGYFSKTGGHFVGKGVNVGWPTEAVGMVW